MDDSESPRVNHREVSRAVEEHCWQIEDWDRDRSAQKQAGDLAALGIAQSRDKCANQQTEPEEQCNCEQHLPGAAEFEVLPSLIAEPEPKLGQKLQHAGPFTQQAADDDNRQRPE